MWKIRFASVLVALLMCSGTAWPVRATPIDYRIDFVLGVGSPGNPTEVPTYGRFTYDATVPAFTNFHIGWLGMDLDLTASANNPFVDAASNPTCPNPGPATSFTMLSGACNIQVFWHGDNHSFLMEPFGQISPLIQTTFQTAGNFGRGSLTIAEIPEPATVTVALLGLLCVVGWKRLSRSS